MKYGGFSFNSSVQNQRGALLLNSGILYVPHGGQWGGLRQLPRLGNRRSCSRSEEHDSLGNRGARRLGLGTDGRSIFVATGNTFGVRTWMGGEAIIRLGMGAKFSGNSVDYFTPSNWCQLDDR